MPPERDRVGLPEISWRSSFPGGLRRRASETPVGLELTRFVSDTLEEGREQANAHAAESSADRVGVVYDGYLTVEGERSDAIFIEAQERGATSSVIFAQRYRPGGRFKKFNAIGNAAFVGEGERLF
jgi:hypothetical protein